MDSIKRINVDEIVKEKTIPKPRSFVKERKDKHEGSVPEFDFTHRKLVPNKRGMSNYDILTYNQKPQKNTLNLQSKNRISTVFIHGAGEGVLKAEWILLDGMITLSRRQINARIKVQRKFYTNKIAII
jgi:hypothetical protein